MAEHTPEENLIQFPEERVGHRLTPNEAKLNERLGRSAQVIDLATAAERKRASMEKTYPELEKILSIMASLQSTLYTDINKDRCLAYTEENFKEIANSYLETRRTMDEIWEGITENDPEIILLRKEYQDARLSALYAFDTTLKLFKTKKTISRQEMNQFRHSLLDSVSKIRFHLERIPFNEKLRRVTTQVEAIHSMGNKKIS